MNRTFDEYIELFIKASIQASNCVDYEKNISIRKHNASIDQYRKIAKSIDTQFPQRISDFSELLNHENLEVCVCCAVCMVDIMHTSLVEKQRAINAVKGYIEKTDNAVEKEGFTMWLHQISSI